MNNQDYNILYKKSSFLNDTYVFDLNTKKMFNIHHLNKDKYSMCDIFQLYLNYIYTQKLNNDNDIINLNNSLQKNLNTQKNVVLIKDFFNLIRKKFNS